MTIILYGGHKVVPVFRGTIPRLVCAGQPVGPQPVGVGAWKDRCRIASWQGGGEWGNDRDMSYTWADSIAPHMMVAWYRPFGDGARYVYVDAYTDDTHLGRIFTIIQGPQPPRLVTFNLPENATRLALSAPTELKDAIRLYTL